MYVRYMRRSLAAVGGRFHGWSESKRSPVRLSDSDAQDHEHFNWTILANSIILCILPIYF